MSYGYNAVGARTKLVYPDGDLINYQYDVLNRLTEIDDATGQYIVRYQYDDASRRTSLMYANGTWTSYGYDKADRLTYMHGGGKSKLSLDYVLNPSGDITRISEGTIQKNYSYDILHRLISSALPAGTTSFNYDRMGNRTSVSSGSTTNYTANALNQYTQVAAVNYSYDLNGNLTSDTARSFTYDSENRMTGAAVGAVKAAMTYDPFGRRVTKTINGDTTRFVYNGNQIIQSSRGTGAAKVILKYVWGPGIDEAVRMYNSTKGQWYYYHNDHLRSVREITDNLGNVVERCDYDAFGTPTIKNAAGSTLTASALGNTTLFAGREWDSEISLYYYRARAYDPKMGRFLQPDPIGYGDGMNMYAHVHNNPLKFRDPMGLCGIGQTAMTAQTGMMGSIGETASLPSLGDVIEEKILRDEMGSLAGMGDMFFDYEQGDGYGGGGGDAFADNEFESENPSGHGKILGGYQISYYEGAGGACGSELVELDNGEIITYGFVGLGAGFGLEGGSVQTGDVYNVYDATDYEGTFINLSGSYYCGESVAVAPGGGAYSTQAGAATPGASGSVQTFWIIDRSGPPTSGNN